MELTVVLAILPILAGVGVWAIRLDHRLTAHEAEDRITHEYMKITLADLSISIARVNEKLDRLIERA